MRITTRQLRVGVRRCFALAVSLSALALVCAAQSASPEAPTPVTSGEIAGRIAPLDVGDPRLTRHFYTFGARQGDLELTVEADNLEGDIDLFSSVAMRPLAKVTLYAGIGSTVTRTVFFRREETVILRVQARSPNDADGTYRIRLGGTFVASTAPAPAEPPAPEVKTATRGAYRVNSIGARIEEPKPEVAAAPQPSPEPTETTNTPAPVTTRPAPTRTPARGRANTRRSTARTGATQQNAPQPSTSGEANNSPSATPANTPAGGESARGTTARGTASRRTSPTRVPRAGTSSRTAGTSSSASRTDAAPSNSEPATPATSNEAGAPAAAGAPALGLEAPGSRIVIELRDGTRVVREMSEVRRFAIEGRLVVITLKNGRVERQPLSNVQRMSIEP
ncbi:MAG: hypothetical protein LC746_11680 [Acidobacteria bacterium]|nr:hypothetical protein [Acidobacteriota bacterium]